MNARPTGLLGRGLYGMAFALSLLAAAGITSMAGIIVTSVLMRKAFNAPLYFSEELVGLLMSVSLFLALPMVTLRGSHVRVTILASYLDARKAALLAGLACVVGIVFCGWMTVEAVPWLEFALNLNLKTETSRMLLYPWMAVLPLSIFLTGVVFVARLFGWIEPVQETENKGDG